MTLNMLVFEYREVEKNFFGTNKFDNFNIKFYTDTLTPETVENFPEDILENTNVISVFINSVINEKVINAFKNLRIISTRSTGYDHIDLNACQNKNIAVINVENYGETSVAQYTFGLIIMLVRKIYAAAISVKNCENTNMNFNGRDISKLTIGVIGTGAIGSAVCRLAKCFGMNILASDINPKRELEELSGFKYVNLEELLKKSDIVTIHVPYTGHNYHMISQNQFELMKESACIINTSRGELINLQALYDRIKNGKLAGAALDVLMCESISFNCKKFAENINQESLKCYNEVKTVEKLNKYHNVIITPHIAYDTLDSVNYILEVTMRSIKEVLYGGKASGII